MKNGIPNDEFAPYAKSSVESYLKYLNDLSMQKNPTENGNSLSALLEQKSGKQEENRRRLTIMIWQEQRRWMLN